MGERGIDTPSVRRHPGGRGAKVGRVQQSFARRIISARGTARHGEQRFLRRMPVPVRHALVWVDPQECSAAYLGFHSGFTGVVRAGDWDVNAADLSSLPRIEHCRRHWLDGETWEETGAYDYVMSQVTMKGRPVDGCRTRDDVVERYRRLDRTFEIVRAEGRLRTQRELRRCAFREAGGVYLHVGRGGTILFSGYGHHRLAMAQCLGLHRMPAAIGLVHEEMVDHWRDAVSTK